MSSRWSVAVMIVAGLVACTVATPATTPVRSTDTPSVPTRSSAQPPLAGSAKPVPSPSIPPVATSSPAASPPQEVTPADQPATTATVPPGRLSAWQIVSNGGFDSGVNPWKAPYGRLKTTTYVFHAGTGAAQLTTSDVDAYGDHRGTFGQCVDASGRIGDWPQVDGRKYITFEAFLKTGAGITGANLVAIFFENTKCSGEQLNPTGTAAVGENLDWTRVSATTAMPDQAHSIHVYVWATGRTSTATVYVDDIQAWAADPRAAP